MAGELVSCAAREGRGEIVPVDSEHSAILQCLTGTTGGPRHRGTEAPRPFSRIILTASGARSMAGMPGGCGAQRWRRL